MLGISTTMDIRIFTLQTVIFLVRILAMFRVFSGGSLLHSRHRMPSLRLITNEDGTQSMNSSAPTLPRARSKETFSVRTTITAHFLISQAQLAWTFPMTADHSHWQIWTTMDG